MDGGCFPPLSNASACSLRLSVGTRPVTRRRIYRGSRGSDRLPPPPQSLTCRLFREHAQEREPFQREFTDAAYKGPVTSDIDKPGGITIEVVLVGLPLETGSLKEGYHFRFQPLPGRPAACIDSPQKP